VTPESSFKQSATKRLGCIDGLRGYLALGVFIHHFAVTRQYKTTGEWARPDGRFLANCGDVAVALFFMITGFLFVNRLLDNHAQGRPMRWGPFFIARVFRLFPLYIAVVAAIFAIVFAVGGAELRETPFVLFKRAAQWMLFMTPDINRFPDTDLIVAGVTWTLRYEWVFYLALPLVALMLRGRGRILLSIAAALTLLFFFRPVAIPVVKLFTAYFILFWAGGVAAWAWRRETLKRWARTPAAAGVAAAALLLALLGFDDTLAPAPALLMTVFFVTVALGNSLGGLLNLRLSIVLGDISYSIYLLHGIVLYLAFSVFALQTQWPWMPVLGLIVILVSWATHRLIERPGIALGKKLAAARRATRA
jgi:peptidoglycan/LPS O-acetylase OafA/YrhL